MRCYTKSLREIRGVQLRQTVARVVVKIQVTLFAKGLIT